MLEQYSEILERAWGKVEQEATVWDSLEIKNSSFYYRINQEVMFLSGFKSKNLPKLPDSLTLLGKVLTKLSPFANIMSRCPGTEEVTFFALGDSPQSGLLGRKMDKQMLKVVGPPLVWRREKIRQEIQNKLKYYTSLNQSFFFLDIGSGGGFDSLEIERIINRLNNLSEGSFDKHYASLNVDIDSKWLKINQILTEKLFDFNHHIIRDNRSIFEILSKDKHSLNLNYYDNLIISCNGFAEFLSDLELRKLYEGIFELAQKFDGSICIILPFANKNEQHEAIGHKIGFNFRTKEKSEFHNMIEEVFKSYKVTYSENNSQIVLKVEKIKN